MGFATEDSGDGGRGVEAGCYGSAEGFDAGDCGGGSAGDDDVDWGFEDVGILGES